MSSLENQVLHHYRDGTRLLAQGPVAKLPAPLNDPSYDVDSADDHGLAMEQILIRQANVILRVHDAVVAPPQSISSFPATANDDDAVDEPLLQQRLRDLATMITSRFYAYRHDLLPGYWRRLYTDTLILTSHYELLASLRACGRASAQALDAIVESLDRALIIAGGAGRVLGVAWVDRTIGLLEKLWAAQEAKADAARPAKRQRTSSARVFSSREVLSRTAMGMTTTTRACPRHEGWTLDRFEVYMNNGGAAEGPRPVVFTDLMREWPALKDRPWSEPEYLVARTFGGRRLVPVEVGRSYVDEGWGQELITFREFLKRYISPPSDDDDDGDDDDGDGKQASSSQPQPRPIGYLAQHDLFRQIPSLRADIRVPDLCWASVPGHPTDPSRNHPPVDVPQLNAWFGPAGTITPLHTDGYHNLLCQAVGAKYVRLYPPGAQARLRPRGVAEGGVDMSNTSEVDVGVLEGWDEDPDGGVTGEEEGKEEEEREARVKVARRRRREDMKDMPYWECVLEPGDTLLIPIGWWHYVRSLSVSFSVSFWWN